MVTPLPMPRANPAAARIAPPVTPDGRYIVVRGRLWRRADPGLTDEQRTIQVGRLMDARRAVKHALKASDADAVAAARAQVDAAKVALGERGPVWWTDGAADLNRHLVHNTPYADWFEAIDTASGSGPAAAPRRRQPARP